MNYNILNYQRLRIYISSDSDTMTITIADKKIGDGQPCFIIAEAGVNHNGNFHSAMKLIDVAYESGADAVKFQTFKAKNLVTVDAEKAKYQKKNDMHAESQFEMLKRLELSENVFFKLSKYAKKKGIIFLSTAFDPKGVDVVSRLGVPCFKVPSGEITNIPYLKKIALQQKPIILSTGMSTMHEIEEAVCFLKREGIHDLILLQCTTCYPAPYSSVNLRVIPALKKKFRCPVGYSDHTEGIIIPVAAVALGANVVEKHFTLDKTDLRGPDHQASLNPDELKQMVTAVRDVESSLGSGRKKPDLNEICNISVARKSIVAAKNIVKGSVLRENNLTIKRPGTGIEPRYLQDLIGRKARISLKKDSVLTWEVIE